jgi:hypothetical protein
MGFRLVRQEGFTSEAHTNDSPVLQALPIPVDATGQWFTERNRSRSKPLKQQPQK